MHACRARTQAQAQQRSSRQQRRTDVAACQAPQVAVRVAVLLLPGVRLGRSTALPLRGLGPGSGVAIGGPVGPAAAAGRQQRRLHV